MGKRRVQWTPCPELPNMRRPLRLSSILRTPKRGFCSLSRRPWRPLRRVSFHDPGLPPCDHRLSPVNCMLALGRISAMCHRDAVARLPTKQTDPPACSSADMHHGAMTRVFFAPALGRSLLASPAVVEGALGGRSK
jgi:hypothetical protein